MATETGNAQSQVADPSQSYGLARWLGGTPSFAELNTPKAVYGGPSAGQMNIGQQTAQVPQAFVSRFNDMASDGADGDRSGLVGGAAKWGATEEKFASPFSPSNYGRYGSVIGNLAGPVGGLVGAGLGGYYDINNLDNQQAALGFAGPMTPGQVAMGYLNKGTFGILGNSWENASISNLLDAVAAYEEANPELMNKLNQDSWADDRNYGWDGGYGGWAGREFARDLDDSEGPGARDSDNPSDDRDDDNETGGGD
jgi:hypothetical protein